MAIEERIGVGHSERKNIEMVIQAAGLEFEYLVAQFSRF